MKNLIIITLIALSCCSLSAQTYKLNKAGQITKTEKTDSTTKRVKTPDKVYKVVDGITFYQGQKGGVYYYKTSKKTNKQYKCYVKD